MGSRAEALNRKRMRYGFGVGLEEYSRRNIGMVRDLQAEILTSEDYIGYFDAYEGTLRVFVFDREAERDRILKEARRIGFDSAGGCEGILSISNADLQRPHLNKIRNNNTFYKELYR